MNQNIIAGIQGALLMPLVAVLFLCLNKVLFKDETFTFKKISSFFSGFSVLFAIVGFAFYDHNLKNYSFEIGIICSSLLIWIDWLVYAKVLRQE